MRVNIPTSKRIRTSQDCIRASSSMPFLPCIKRYNLSLIQFLFSVFRRYFSCLILVIYHGKSYRQATYFLFIYFFIKCLEIREIYNGIDVKNENFQRILLIFTENILRRRTISRVMSLGDHLSSTIVANRLKRPT